MQQRMQYVIWLQYVCFGNEILIISPFWQRTVSARLFRLASLHQPGVPRHPVPMIPPTETLSDTPAHKQQCWNSPNRAGGGGGMMFSSVYDSQLGQTDGQIDWLCSDR